MFLQKLTHVVSMFFQWWLTSDQILFRRFLEHREMILSLGIGLGINILGVFSLYLPINFLIPETKIKKIRTYLRTNFPSLRRHLKRVENFTDDFENGQLVFSEFKENRKKAISKLIDTYEYDYLFIFGLSCLPIPFLGAIMTVGALFAIETLEIRFGLLVVILAKVIKVFALASIAYFAYFL